jgi:hypothetical protein
MSATFAKFKYGQTNTTAGGALMGNFHEPLSHDQLHRAVPSIFAESAHHRRSEAYGFVPTIQVIDALANEGFRPVFACEAKARDVTRFGYTKHMVRFRRENDTRSDVGIPELIMLNSHDGSTKYKLLSGVFRTICANGLIVGDRFQEVNVAHKRRLVDDVIEGTYSVVQDFTRSLGVADHMRGRLLSAPQQRLFAEAALPLRFPDVERWEDAPVTPDRVLTARRWEDKAKPDGTRDLWTTFNVMQENMVRGGMHGVSVNADGKRRNVTTREVKGIDGNVKLNRALWTLAEKMADLTA